jgi:2-polyprenyl-3-methyl-5-hydroxy-6-metoxy-1,4-benzoquinol methylase
MNNKKDHWDKVYQQKQLSELSWYEPVPETSLQIINGFNLPKEAAIIDIGGGDSLLVDHLLELGFTNMTVLDISLASILRAKQRLGKRAANVNWIISDMLLLTAEKKYDLWHDRAAFHFLTDEADQQEYLDIVHRLLKPKGYLILSTFADDGPSQCSGLPVQRYGEGDLAGLFSKYFNRMRCFTKEHLTPFQTLQKFIFCSFQSKS